MNRTNPNGSAIRANALQLAARSAGVLALCVAVLTTALTATAQTKTPSAPAAERAADRAGATAADKERKKAWGVLISQDGKTRIDLTKDRVIVGSSPTADAQIDHPTVATRHTEISHESGAVYIKDLGARFGTLAAGTEVRKGQRFRIVQRTLLTFGAISYTFEFGNRDVIPPTMEAPKAAKGEPKASDSTEPAPTRKAKPAKRASAKRRKGKANRAAE